MTERVTIIPLDNGPYLVEGSGRVGGCRGRRIPDRTKEHGALPLRRLHDQALLCDGTHSKVGFVAAQKAVREEEGRG